MSRYWEALKHARFLGWRRSIRLAIERIDPLLAYPFGRLEYWYCLTVGRPYFGKFHAASQGFAERHAFIRCLISSELRARKAGRYEILEVGSWAGGSAIVWAQALKHFIPGRGVVVCVDPWISYFDPAMHRNVVHRAMMKATKKDAIFRLFLHNVRASGVDDLVVPFRGSSDRCLPMLKNGQFDLVYLDGDHSYDAVLRDLTSSSPLIKEGGILCGDDLELQFSAIDQDIARAKSGNDFVRDPKTGEFFHPGVTLATWDFFQQELSNWNGFWAMRKSGSKWNKVEIASD